MSTALPVIVTRPAREAAQWVDTLRAAGLEAVALPLIEIAPVEDAAALHAAWHRLAAHAALMFVSASAVEHFLAQRPDALAVLPVAAAGRRCWATGPGTAAALQRAGVPADAIDTPPVEAARFDSEALWAQVRAQVAPGVRVLIVRGGDAAGRPSGREWLAREIEAAGGERDTVVAYRRLAPQLGEAALQLAAEGAAGRAIWIFSSSEAVANLVQALPATAWHAARALATHARIAQAAQAAGFGTVRICPPLHDALVASIESLA